MDEEGFRDFCLKGERVKKGLSEKTIQAHIGIVKEFEAFLKKKNKNKDFTNATVRDLQNFVQYLIENEKNTWDNFLALLRYARFVNNEEVDVALQQLLDGSNVLEDLSHTVRQTVGESKHNRIFKGIKLPTLGTSSKDWSKITKKFMERLEAELDEKTCREILLSGPHAGPKEVYSEERKKFLESKGIDDFLRKRHKEFVDLLEKHMKEKTLFFNQEIDEEVLEYVRSNPTCQNGVREGDIIYVTKIPYMAKEYLYEKDKKMKRYYYCHCPWVREAIRSGMKISPNFCYCSAGFEKRPWDVIFDKPVRADVIETVLKGDLVCKFALHIPKEYIKSLGSCAHS
jgi:site-specific recombinase XerD